jgi:hypothetical protein
VICDHDDLDAITPLVDAAFRGLRPAQGEDGYWPRTRDWLEWRDLRGAGVVWHREPAGTWTVGQPSALSGRMPPKDLYSLRVAGEDGRPDDKAFPFSTWAGMLARARRILREAAAAPWLEAAEVRALLGHVTETADLARLPDLGAALRAAGCAHPMILGALAAGVEPARSVWVIELLAGLDQGTFLKRHFGTSPLATARTFELDLTVPVRGRAGADRELFAEIGRALREQDLGYAETSGGSMVKDAATGEYVAESSSLDIMIRDDLDAGVSLISEVLRRHGGLDGVRLTHAAHPHTELGLT